MPTGLCLSRTAARAGLLWRTCILSLTGMKPPLMVAAPTAPRFSPCSSMTAAVSVAETFHLAKGHHMNQVPDWTRTDCKRHLTDPISSPCVALSGT